MEEEYQQFVKKRCEWCGKRIRGGIYRYVKMGNICFKCSGTIEYLVSKMKDSPNKEKDLFFQNYLDNL